MEAPQPAAFLGLPFELWVMIFMAALAAYAAVVATRRKRQSFATLGDHEPYEGPELEASAHPDPAGDDLARANARETTPDVNSPSIAATQPKSRR
jgi:hypothetical protein